MDDRHRDRLQIGRVHLVVRRHHDGDAHVVLDRALVAGDDGGADAGVALVLDHLDPSVLRRGRPGPLCGRVERGVVDDVDPVDEAGDAGQRLLEQRLLVVGGDDDRDALALEH